jgi:probable HAF family extracellular repeat protein
MVWAFDRKIPLGTLGGTNSNVVWPGQNEPGLVVGIAQTNKPQTRADGWSCRGFFPDPDASRFTCLGFVWEGGKMRRLPTLGGDNGFATGANNRRQVVGWAENRTADPTCQTPTDRQFRAVLWDLAQNRTTELLPYDQDSTSAATAINDRGQVVGISGECDQSIGRLSAKHAVLWEEDGTVKDLKNLGSPSWNTPTAINRLGDMIVGFANAAGADPANPRLRAFLWTSRDGICPKLPGTDLCDLGTLDPGGSAQAWGVNDRGQVVGSSCLGAVCKAFLWENGVMKNLNAFKGDYPHQLENAMDINNFGQISGRVLAADGRRSAFIATPTH